MVCHKGYEYRSHTKGVCEFAAFSDHRKAGKARKQGIDMRLLFGSGSGGELAALLCGFLAVARGQVEGEDAQEVTAFFQDGVENGANDM